MSNLSAFMRANVEQIENHKFAASPRIKGEDGKPMGPASGKKGARQC